MIAKITWQAPPFETFALSGYYAGMGDYFGRTATPILECIFQTFFITIQYKKCIRITIQHSHISVCLLFNWKFIDSVQASQSSTMAGSAY